MGNRYFKVTKADKVNVLNGRTVPSGIYYGAAQVLNQLVDTVPVKRGDEIHRLVGGDFLVRKDGTTAELRMFVPASPGYNRDDSAMREFMARSTEEIPASAARPVNRYR